MSTVADDEPLGLDLLRGYVEKGQAWVIADRADVPVAYLLAEVFTIFGRPVRAASAAGRSSKRSGQAIRNGQQGTPCRRHVRMQGVDDYRKLNRANWDERAAAHANSPDYNVQGYIDDPALIGDVVQFDHGLLGNLSGVRGVHLQCHIGTDTVGLSRLGAQMTGLDFSPAAIEQARAFVARSGDDVRFVESDIYDSVSVLGSEQFDLVFTGIGSLCWLPSISRWAATVAALLKPGGRLFIREGHPMLWSLAEARPDALLVVDFPYFERDEPTVWEDDGTYVQTDATFTATKTHEWNHGLGEIVTALFAEGLQITGLVEHDSVPWEALPGQMAKDDAGEWRLSDRPWRLAASYTLQAVKSACDHLSPLPHTD